MAFIITLFLVLAAVAAIVYALDRKPIRQWRMPPQKKETVAAALSELARTAKSRVQDAVKIPAQKTSPPAAKNRRDTSTKPKESESKQTPVAKTKPVAFTRAAPPTVPTRTSMPMTWFGPEATLRVAGFEIHGPCCYASFDPKRSPSWTSDPSEILLHADVRVPSREVPELGYWPWYSRIDPENRFVYLKWLASGRKDLPLSEGMLFLYYYGLERRLLVDNQDRELVLREIVRLRRLDEPRIATREGNSFRRYSTALLWFEVARAPELFDARAFRIVCELTSSWTLDRLAVALAWHAVNDQPLSAELARSLAEFNPRAKRSVVVSRVPEEFNQLFERRYRERFGDGMCFSDSSRTRMFAYRPASAGLTEASCEYPNVMRETKKLEPLADIWNECIADLRDLSKMAITEDAPADSIESWEAMPAELREGVDHPLTNAVQEVVLKGRETEHEHLVQVSQFAELLKVKSRPKIPLAESRRVAETVEHTGYAVEPDARITGKKYRWDESLAVFPDFDDSQTDSSRYSAAACMLHLGIYIAQADGVIDREELRHLTEHIEAAFDLPDVERRRLEALRSLLFATNVNIDPVLKQIHDVLSDSERQSVGRLLVAIAAADGIVTLEEVKALKKCYRSLGLDEQLIDSTIASLAPENDGDMIMVESGFRSPTAGEPIPFEHTPTLVLDRAAISAIMAETQDVRTMLAAAMAEVEIVEEAIEQGDGADSMPEVLDPPSEPLPTKVVIDAEVSTTSTLDPRYQPFYTALVARECWTRTDADALAREHGVMLSGAIEAINDWAWESLEAPLIDDDDENLSIDQSLL